MTIEETLKARCAHDYPGMIAHPDGWDDIVQRLHDKLVEIVPDYTVAQTKEKFGGLRFYLGPLEVDQETWDTVYKLIGDAEAESYRTCENCGDLGETRGGSWSRTLCDACNEEYEQRRAERDRAFEEMFGEEE